MLTKMVDGKNVEMSPEEEAEIRAEWSANDLRPAPKPALTVEALKAKLIAAKVLPAE